MVGMTVKVGQPFSLITFANKKPPYSDGFAGKKFIAKGL